MEYRCIGNVYKIEKKKVCKNYRFYLAVSNIVAIFAS